MHHCVSSVSPHKYEIHHGTRWVFSKKKLTYGQPKHSFFAWSTECKTTLDHVTVDNMKQHDVTMLLQQYVSAKTAKAKCKWHDDRMDGS